MQDYSEVTVKLNMKINNMNAALNCKKWFAALLIMRDLEKDFQRLIEITTNNIENKS
jgi:hypothetical protein